MLSKIKISNFRSFNQSFEFDLSSSKNYEFNDFAIKNNNINHSVIYGRNGCGKSNLGLAILDIVTNIAPDDLVRINSLNDSYLNADSIEKEAHFHFEFIFEGNRVIYKYGKKSSDRITYETLTINGDIVLEINRAKSNLASYYLKGTESLIREIPKDNMSIVRYVSRNTILEKDDINNRIFESFTNFVNSMVFFRTLTKGPEYYGPRIDVKRLSSEIINRDKVQDFQDFLNLAGIDCKLIVTGDGDDKVIEFSFKKDSIEFSRIASTGTHSLGVFYYWYLQLTSGKYQFAYIDEFDAYYHFELAELIVKMLNKLDCQTILTTHNISLINNKLLRPDCYFEMDKKHIVPFYSLVHKDLRRAHNLEKIYKGIHSG
ncbi:AAA family ATPase [Pseudoalteromonas rhizosphaerae]|uniref:ATP/GTP-binding protein n=1 Tax=Pseudoalteromonas rhizosphaerae TaxID=2518973 RepID=A0ABW8L380_9GAMM